MTGLPKARHQIYIIQLPNNQSFPKAKTSHLTTTHFTIISAKTKRNRVQSTKSIIQNRRFFSSSRDLVNKSHFTRGGWWEQMFILFGIIKIFQRFLSVRTWHRLCPVFFCNLLKRKILSFNTLFYALLIITILKILMIPK